MKTIQIRRQMTFGVMMGAIIIGLCEVRAYGENPNPVIKHIKCDWEERQKHCRTIRCTLTGSNMVPKGRYTGDDDLPAGTKGEIPPKDTHNPVKISLLLDFVNNRYRKHVEHEVFNLDLAKFVHKVEDNIYDGEAFNYYNPETEHARRLQVNIVEGERPTPKGSACLFFGYWEFPMVFAHGLVATMPDPRELQEAAKQEFSFHGNAEQNNEQRVVLRTQPDPSDKRLVDEVWVDKERGSVITRWIRYSSNVVQIHTDIVYRQTTDGWMPKQWSGSHYYGKRKEKKGKSKQGQVVNTLSSSFTLNVTDLVVNSEMKKEDFDIKATPGMIVRDYNKGGGLFKVEEDGSLKRIAAGQSGVVRTRDHRVALYIMVVSLAIIGIILVYRIARSRRQRSGS